MNAVIPSFGVKIDSNPNSSNEGLIQVEAEIIQSQGQRENERLLYKFTIDEFLVQEENAIKEDLFYSLLIAGMGAANADLIIANMVMVASDLVYAEGYCLKNTLIISFSVFASYSNEDVRGKKLQPASKQTIESLEVKIYEENDSSLPEECVICFKGFLNGSEVVVLQCGHQFGKKCIKKWLNTSNSCPICRFKLQS